MLSRKDREDRKNPSEIRGTSLIPPVRGLTLLKKWSLNSRKELVESLVPIIGLDVNFSALTLFSTSIEVTNPSNTRVNLSLFVIFIGSMKWTGLGLTK